jgi:hypothetical protein
MPLQLGGVDTARPQLIGWDPTSYDQSIEARKRIETLTREGFILEYEDNGEARLLPPSKDPNIGCFRILSQNGDDRVIWDRRDKNQVKEAFKKFKELIKKGFSAYAATSSGGRGHKITEFNPGLEEIILIPSTIPG